MLGQFVTDVGADFARRAGARLRDLRWVRLEIVLLIGVLVMAG